MLHFPSCRSTSFSSPLLVDSTASPPPPHAACPPQAFHSSEDGVLRSRLNPASATELAAVLRMLAPHPHTHHPPHQTPCGGPVGCRAEGGACTCAGDASPSCAAAGGCDACCSCCCAEGTAGRGRALHQHQRHQQAAFSIRNEAGSLMPPAPGQEEEQEEEAGEQLLEGEEVQAEGRPLSLPLPAAAAAAGGHAAWLRLLRPLRLQALDLYGVSVGRVELAALAELASLRVRACGSVASVRDGQG
jgi:hypothetical protein